MIVITGGAGFIGSNLVAALEEASYGPLAVCDALGNQEKWRNVAKREIHEFIPLAGLMDFLEKRSREIEVVIHMGAISSTTESNADLVIENNFILSSRLWDWCTLNDVRFIYASSAATYGNGAQGFVDDETPEKLAGLRPLNPYGWSKHLFDRRVSRILRDEGARPLQWAGLKFFNAYGPNEYHKGEQMSVVCKLYPQIVAGMPARLFKSHHPDYADGGQLRDFIHVSDCVDVILWLLDNPGVCGLYNVGSGQARSFADLARACFEAIKKPAYIDYIEMPTSLQDKYQYFTQADMSKLRKAGYLKPFVTLEEGIYSYIAGYLSQPDPYR